tara:strand:+ start:280 stop:1317 length:1038 start_codon:yes stop_codon:yes gene_type:complete
MTDHFTNGASVASGSILITEFDRKFFSMLTSNIPDDVCLIDTTWIDDPNVFKNFVDWQRTVDRPRAFLYSGMDWSSVSQGTHLAKTAHTFFPHRFDCTHIGNANEGHYFSFWVEFIDAHREYFFDDAYTSPPDFQHHFMCLNNKCNDHRAYLLNAIFKDERVWKRGNISVIEQDKRYNFQHPIILEESRPRELVKKFYKWETLSYKHIKNDIVSLGDPRHWRSHFITVVTESVQHSDVFLSEKIFKPLIGLRPFLALGDRNLYAKLRNLGFDTFDDLFPNVGLWHDNYQHRANNLMKDLSNFCQTPLSDLDPIYNSIYTRLERNRENMISLIETNKQWIQDLSKV